MWLNLLKNILTKIQINTIRTKLVFAFIFVGLVPFLIFAIFSYNTYSGVLQKKITEYSEEVVFGMQKQLDDSLQDIASLLDMKNDYYINQCIKLIQAEEYAGNRKYIFRLWEDFSNIRKIKPEVKEVALTFENGRRLSNYGFYYPQNYDKKIINNITHTPSGYLLSNPHPDFYGDLVITLASPFNIKEMGSDVIISASVDIEFLQDLTDVQLGAKGYVFIVDENRKIIYHPDSSRIGLASNIIPEDLGDNKSGNFIYHKDNTKYILTFATSEFSNWKIFSVAYASHITAELNKLKRLTFVGIGVIISSLILLIIYLSAYLTKPIRELEIVTKNAVNNNLKIDIATKGDDEIANLSRSFNKMMDRIRKLVRENIAEQKQIRDLEMKSLHEQIKPHFIYNTLDLIIGYLEDERAGKASYLIETLGNFFRLSFAKGKEMVRIEEELEHLRSYLNIQQQRFANKFEFFINLEDKQINNYYIPKLLLQPLIENAIYHGVLEKKGKGLLIIKGYRKKEAIIFEIIDNGPGIPSGMIADINVVLRGEKQSVPENKYFGLRNVNKRIKIKFGFNYGLTLRSKPGIKTVTEVRIGLIEEDNYE